MSDTGGTGITLLVERDSNAAIEQSLELLNQMNSSPVLLLSRSTITAPNLTVLDPDEFMKFQREKSWENHPLAQTHSALILDNVPHKHQVQLLALEAQFDHAIAIQAYPVPRPNVAQIIVSGTNNKFVWDSLYEAYMGGDEKEKQMFNEFTSSLAPNRYIRCLAASGNADVRWTLSTTEQEQPSEKFAAATVPMDLIATLDATAVAC